VYVIQHAQRATPDKHTEPKEIVKRGNIDIEQVKTIKDTQYYDTYIKIWRSLDYRLGLVSGECHWGLNHVKFVNLCKCTMNNVLYMGRWLQIQL